MVNLSRRVLAMSLTALVAPAYALSGPPLLFRVVGPRDEVVIGLTQDEFERAGTAPGIERLARKLVAEGQLTAWLYVVGRGPDGTTRYVTTGRIAILRSDTLRLEPYTAALPVIAPPAS